MFAPPIARTKPKSSAAPRSTAVTPAPSRAGAPQPVNTVGGRARLKPPVQPKLKVGDGNDPLEREADRVAGEVVSGPDATTQPPRLRADTTGALPEPERTKSPELFSGRGDPLPAPMRGYFERRFDHDFTGVRLHHGPDAARSALSFGARAYTYGRDIVFGAGEFAPSSNRTRGLLAHELAHVVQQGAGQPLLQRSKLSDEIKEAFTKDPKIETLLAQLSRAEVQAAQTDADVDAEIARILAGRPDDLWLAERIRQGKLGDTTGARHPKKTPQPIKAFFFAGSTDRRALVIGGVHGTEKQGIDVAELLIKELQSAADAAGAHDDRGPFAVSRQCRTGQPQQRRHAHQPQLPGPRQDLAAADKLRSGTALDALSKAILPENQLLMKLMERFKPERIISIHGTHHLGAAGISFDRRSLRADEVEEARDWAAKRTFPGPARPRTVKVPRGAPSRRDESHVWSAVDRMLDEAEQTDTDLSLRAAKQIDTATAGITGRDARKLEREHDPKELSKTQKDAREAHPSIAGNIGKTGKIDFAQWSGGGSDPGFSLGGYAPARGMSVFTVEPPVDAPLSEYPIAEDPKDPKKTKWARDDVSGAKDKLIQADRITELKAYADAVRTVLLGT